MNRETEASVLACPDRDTLAAFCRGRLPDGPLEAVAEHVSTCSRCATILEQLQIDDTLLSHLRRRPTDNPMVDDALCQCLAEKARALAEAESLPATISAASNPEAETGPPLPAVFGPYLLLQRLGQGGMGVVYQARQETLKRLVAVKMIRAGMYANNEERQRFRREGEAIARIRHAHVVQIHEFGEHEGQPYFSMELLEGGTLTSRLRAGALPQREAAALVRTLAQAVAAAHEQGIVHRDLKPGNVLFSADGTAKITDFGLAKILDGENSETLSDAILGTPVYMAPEQARGESRQIGPATDVYALGAILYECLTGQPPFRGGSRSRTLELVRGGEPEPPSRHRRELSLDLEAICLKCLEKEPGHRYSSAAELAEDLDRWLRDEPTLVRPVGWSMRFWRRLRRHPRWAFAAALLLLAAAALTVGLWYRDPDRPIRTIENELARGREQTLIGETGGPLWARWCAGDATSQMSILADGTFTLGSWQTALVELVPDPKRSNYRFRALIRHEKGVRQAEIGIYVARRSQANSSGLVHQFVALTFYDIELDTASRSKALNAPIPAKLLPPLKGNRAMLDPHLYADRVPVPWETGILCGPRSYFDPAGVGGQEWRELAVEVTPEGIQGFWSGKAMGVLTGNLAITSINAYLESLRESQPHEPLADGLEAVYAPRGGLGLYVHNGSASFRRVVIEPLQ